MSLTIATVLKSGGDFKPEHVTALYYSITKLLPAPLDFKFVCLTDMESVVVNTIPLTEDLFGWWSKLELFKPGQFDTELVFYMDLDTMVWSDFSFILSYEGGFCITEDFYRKRKRCQSTLMLFKPTACKPIWDYYQRSSCVFDTAKVPPYKGDQGFIEKAIKNPDFFQDLWPGKFISYKQHCCRNRNPDKFIGVPEETSVICFHGKPRPWETALWRKQCK